MANRDIVTELLKAIECSDLTERVNARVPKDVLLSLEALRQSLEESERRKISLSDLLRGCLTLFLKRFVDLPCYVPFFGTASLNGQGRRFEVRVTNLFTLIFFPHSEDEAHKVWPFLQLTLTKFEPHIPGFAIQVEPLTKLPKEVLLGKQSNIKTKNGAKHGQLSLAKEQDTGLEERN